MTNNIAVSHVTLYSADMDKTALFYQALGIDLQKSGSWSGSYHYLAVLNTHGYNQFFTIHAAKPGTAVGREGLGFNVFSVPEVLQRLVEVGVKVTRPGNPRVYAHCRVAEMEDPDGRVVGLYQHGG